MKKHIYSIAMAMMTIVAMALSLSSCEFIANEDYGVSRTLEGTWDGNMYQEYYYSGAYYEPSYSEVCFLRDPYRYSSGEGYWVDYFNSYVPWGSRYIANHIEWKVQYGTIYIYLIEDDIEFTIRHYNLTDGYFNGELYGSDGSLGKFRLRHVSSPNWNNYNWGWSSSYPYYAPGANGNKPASAETPERPIRITH